jgi:hypothetical protein
VATSGVRAEVKPEILRSKGKLYGSGRYEMCDQNDEGFGVRKQEWIRQQYTGSMFGELVFRGNIVDVAGSARPAMRYASVEYDFFPKTTF